MSAEERSLADVVAETSVDTSPDLTPEDFDLDAWINGMRPIRRSIQLFARGDLIARLDEIAAKINNADDDAPELDALIDEFESVQAEFKAGQWFTVEKRSSEWQEKFRLDMEKELGFKRVRRDDDDEPTLTDKEAAEISMHQCAAQIVAPAGVTYKHLRHMLDTNEGELVKLLATMHNVNSQLAQSAELLNRDFSHRRSTKNATPAS